MILNKNALKDRSGGFFGAKSQESNAQNPIGSEQSPKAILVSVLLPGNDEANAIISLAELKRLLETAGGEFFAKMIQSKRAPDPATYLGSGKAIELRNLCHDNGVSLVVFDCELSPSQIRNLEKLINEDEKAPDADSDENDETDDNIADESDDTDDNIADESDDIADNIADESDDIADNIADGIDNEIDDGTDSDDDDAGTDGTDTSADTDSTATADSPSDSASETTIAPSDAASAANRSAAASSKELKSDIKFDVIAVPENAEKTHKNEASDKSNANANANANAKEGAKKPLKVRVLDRSMLILDIFALHAVTGEGKLQVELAQLKYTIPRLIGRGNELSRLGGGIGTRGPGESKLESDKRHVKRRIAALEAELERMEKNRATMRSKRDRSGNVKVAIAGYTNAGKSTLLNRLTGAGILVEDKLFATLDPTTRRLTLPLGTEVLITDTVGFIRNLPHHLIEAFKSTLDEVTNSDIILVLADASDPECASQLEVTETLISELYSGESSGNSAGKSTAYSDYADTASGAPNSNIAGSAEPSKSARVLYVYNKCDRSIHSDELPKLKDTDPENIIFISAETGEGVDKLLSRLEELALEGSRRVEFVIPHDKQAAVNILYKNSTVENVEYCAEGVRVTAIADEKVRGQLKDYLADEYKPKPKPEIGSDEDHD